jgi:uncharacterized protein YjbJ (UPF0337 family)
MDWNEIQNNWDEFKDKVQKRWDKLTDKDLQAIAGKRDQLTGKLKEKYGIAEQEAEQRIDAFCDQCSPATRGA